MTTETERIFWGGMDDEVLIHSEPHEAIEDYLDGLHPVGFEEIGEVTMYEYKPMKAMLSTYVSPLEMVLEVLEEEYGNPDGGDIEVTAAMKEAEQAFLKAVLAEYRPWACEQTGEKITVNALAWVREHRPDWLEKPPPPGAISMTDRISDKELADKVTALIGRSGELAMVIDDAAFVRDWRVAGALMDECVNRKLTIEALRDHEGTYWCAIDDAMERPPAPTILGECTSDSLPRAIIEACVKALEGGSDE